MYTLPPCTYPPLQHCSRVQKYYGLQDEAVSEPGGAGLDAAVPSARRQQAEQFVTRVVGVFDNPFSFLPTLLGVEVLHGWQLPANDVLGSFYIYDRVEIGVLYGGPEILT